MKKVEKKFESVKLKKFQLAELKGGTHVGDVPLCNLRHTGTRYGNTIDADLDYEITA